VIALAGAAALAGLGYTIARRSGSRAARSTGASIRSPRRGEARPKAAETITLPETAPKPVPWQAVERISSSPDVLDLALDLDGVFDGKGASEIEVTARPNQHLPAPHTGDDEEAPSADDLGRTWLTHATESERSLCMADTLPDVEELGEDQASDDLGEDKDSEGSSADDDETTIEYVRRHRISSAG